MTIQIITTCNYLHGTLQHALMLGQAWAKLTPKVRLINVRCLALPFVRYIAQNAGIELIDTIPDDIPEADLSFVVGLWDQPCAESARRLVYRQRRLVLVPTVYWDKNFLPDFPGRAQALWYVSWDQAIHARPYWDLAEQVEVVPCAIDVNRFCPSGRMSTGQPWVLCRHSRDAYEKFAPDVTLILSRLGNTYDVVFNMLGAIDTIGKPEDTRIRTFTQNTIDPVKFLQDGDIWVYAHASYWRETACIAMLEAMACGLPVLVSSAGGMREYLIHGQTGFACCDRGEFIQFAQLLLEHPTLFQTMRMKARNFVCQEHSLERLAKQIKEKCRFL